MGRENSVLPETSINLGRRRIARNRHVLLLEEPCDGLWSSKFLPGFASQT
jgi:hypothetical protein